MAKDVPGLSAYVLSLRNALREGGMERIALVPLGDLAVEVCRSTDSIWVLIRRPGRGGLAVRAAYVPGGDFTIRTIAPTSSIMAFTACMFAAVP